MTEAGPVKLPPPPRPRRRRWPLLLGGVLMLLTVLFFVLPRLIYRWGHNCGRVEPTEGLDKIKHGARMFFVTEHYDRQGNLLPARFPRSVPPTPPKPHCDKAVTAGALWAAVGWRELKFEITEPHDYTFEFHSAGTGAAAVFTARARGDLDCDGDQSTFELRGSIDDKYGTVKVVGPIVSNEIE